MTTPMMQREDRGIRTDTVVLKNNNTRLTTSYRFRDKNRCNECGGNNCHVLNFSALKEILELRGEAFRLHRLNPSKATNCINWALPEGTIICHLCFPENHVHPNNEQSGPSPR